MVLHNQQKKNNRVERIDRKKASVMMKTMNTKLNMDELIMITGGTGPLRYETGPLKTGPLGETGPLGTCDPPCKTGPLGETGPLGFPPR